VRSHGLLSVIRPITPRTETLPVLTSAIVWFLVSMASCLASPRAWEQDGGAMEPRIQYAQTADGVSITGRRLANRFLALALRQYLRVEVPTRQDCHCCPTPKST
jgi:ABC-type transport system involved in cytochrome c biogenesis permease component